MTANLQMLQGREEVVWNLKYQEALASQCLSKNLACFLAPRTTSIFADLAGWRGSDTGQPGP